MERTSHQASNCSIARTLGVVGDKWTLLIIRESLYGATRFEQFHSVLQCPRNLLSKRLARLVDDGIMRRSEYRVEGSRTRSEYQLTESGRELGSILMTLREWGDRHLADEAGPPLVAVHRGCGHEVEMTPVCEEGHVLAGLDEVELVEGPGLLTAVPQDS